MHRLSQAGFSQDFVRHAILPDWWDEQCSHDPSLVRDVEFRVARFLGLPMQAIADPGYHLAPPEYPNVQLRRVRATARARLRPAIHAATRIATAVVRNLRDTTPLPRHLPQDGRLWRDTLTSGSTPPRLATIVEALWQLGVPVVPLRLLPVPSFQGMACIVGDRPVILVAQNHDAPGRVAFVLAHEAGHIAAGDCAAGKPVVDEEDDIVDNVEMERLADRYATAVLVGDSDAAALDTPASVHFKKLASRAVAIEQEKGADASFIIFSWARRTGNYATAMLAVKALYRATGARRQLCAIFDRHVDSTAATETDRSLLLCARGASSSRS